MLLFLLSYCYKLHQQDNYATNRKLTVSTFTSIITQSLLITPEKPSRNWYECRGQIHSIDLYMLLDHAAYSVSTRTTNGKFKYSFYGNR